MVEEMRGMENRTEILLADLSNPAHSEATRSLIDAFARDPSGQSAAIAPHILVQTIAMLRSHPSARILLAFHAGQPAGIATCYLGFGTFAAARTLHIHDLFVEAGSRGFGIGRALIEACADCARADGCAKLRIEVLMHNRRAVRLYEAAGFLDEYGPTGTSTTLTRALGASRNRRRGCR